MLAFLKTLYIFSPFVVGQRIIGPRLSALYGIPLVMYGENPAEYGNNIEENWNPRMPERFYMGDVGADDVVLGGTVGRDLMRDHGLTAADLHPYLPVPTNDVRRTECHFLGYYVRWNPQAAYYAATAANGFEPNSERTEGSYSKYSSVDDKIDPLHYFTTFIKYGLGRASYDAAQEIRNGLITREEGVALVKRYDHEVPRKYLAECLDYMGIDEPTFWSTINAAKSPHLWDGDVLRHAVWKEA